jgi:hypothetical protein
MGCFDSVCPFSRTSIHVGDEVLLVALNPNLYENALTTYGLIARTFEKEKFRFIGIGKYNDYGTIEGYDSREDLKPGVPYWLYQFMVHRSVAEGLLEKNLDDFNDLKDAAEELIEIAFTARTQLIYETLLGEQYFDEEELRIQYKLLELTKEVLDRKSEYLKDFD